jgi:hypothetical protein
LAWNVTETIGAGKTHSTIQAFESAHQGDTPTDGTNCTGQCTGDVTAGNTYFAGWQSGMDADTRIVIEADSGQEADGTAGTGSSIDGILYFTELTNAIFFDLISMEAKSVRLEVNNLSGATSEIRVAKCLFQGNTGIGGCIENFNPSVAVNIYVGGSLFRDSTTAYSMGFRSSGSNSYIEGINCTLVGMTGNAGYGAKEFSTGGNGTIVLKNCAIGDCVNDLSAGVATTTCGSEEGDDADDFTEPSTEDYTVYDTNSALYQAGTPIADAWFTSLCATDFAGTSWAGTPSVGCFELAAGGPTVPDETLAPNLQLTESGGMIGEVNV